MSNLFKRGVMTEDSWWDLTRERLEKKGLKESQIKYRLELEDMLLDEEEFEKIYKYMKGVIRGLSKGFICKWGRSYKLEIEDIESLLAERLFLLYSSYIAYHSDKEFNHKISFDDNITFYENFIIQAKTNVLGDYLRYLKAEKRVLSTSNQFLSESGMKFIVSYDDYVSNNKGKASDFNLEQEVISKLLATEICSNSKGLLSEIELNILQGLKNNPSANLNELMGYTNFKYRQQVKRTLESIRKKLELYEK